jgi:hypothetical protein
MQSFRGYTERFEYDGGDITKPDIDARLDQAPPSALVWRVRVSGFT